MIIPAAYLILQGKGAFLDWTPSSAPDVIGYEIWASEQSGGPYVKIHPGLIQDSEGVTDELRLGTYFFVVIAVDGAGNRAVHSNEVSIEIT